MSIYRIFSESSMTQSTEATEYTDYHIYQPLRPGRIWQKVNFLAEFNRFEFWVFLLLN